MLVHHLLPLLDGQRVPLARLDERIDEQVLRLPRHDVEAVFDVFGVILVYVHRALGHREERLRHVEVATERRRVQARGHLLKRVERVADAPEHEVHVRAEADDGVGVHQQPAAVRVEDLDELALGVELR